MAADTISLAVWDVPMPVVAGEIFPIKVGAKSRSGRGLAGLRIEILDPNGARLAAGALGGTPWPGTEALYWTTLEVPAPASGQIGEFAVATGAAATRFSVVAAGKPDRTLSVRISERTTAAPLDGVEIRVGPFHARTNEAGRAELWVCDGEYQLRLWRTAHISEPVPVTIDGDTDIELTMLHVPEEHPDARWVR